MRKTHYTTEAGGLSATTSLRKRSSRFGGYAIKAWIAIFSALVLMGGELSASHYMGGQTTYEALGNNIYRVTQTVYRDCAGISLGGAALLNVNPPNQNVTLQRVSFADITPLCPGQVSRCASTSGQFGVEEHIYRGDVTIFANQGVVTLSSTLNARNAAINTVANAGSLNLYLSTQMNTTLAPNNNSPVFLNRPVAYLCANQPATISPNAFDPDGDAIVYSLTACRTTATVNVPYLAGFSATNPLTSSTPITLNSSNGSLSFTPSVIGQVAIVCVRAEEFRNGVKIGEIIRDIQIRVLNCNNTPPVVAPILNVIVPIGTTYCTNVSATDVNNNAITLTATSGIIPPATFTLGTSGPGFANGTFCFTPTAIHEGNTYTVTIIAQDNACPSPGTGVTTFNITVPAQCRVDAVASATPASCGASNGTATASLIDGTAPFQYSWTGPNGYTNFTQSILNLAAGDYCVTIVDGNGCVDSTCVTVAAAGGNIGLTAAVTNANCGQNNGSITATVSGGTGPYLYNLNGGVNQLSPTFTGLGLGTYVVNVIDASGCTASTTVTVGQAADVTAPVISCQGDISVLSDPGVCGANVSFAAATATDDCGAPTVTQAAGPASGGFFGVGSTTVTFTATDGAGNSSSCSFLVTVTVPHLSVSLTASTYGCGYNVSCNGASDGSITSTVSGGCGTLTYAWSNGATTANNGNLGAGTYTLVVTDGNGTSASATITLTQPDALGLTLSGTNVTCFGGSDGSVSSSTSGGCAPYSYAWNNGSTSANLSNVSAGTYRLTVTDANGCSTSNSYTVTEPTQLVVTPGANVTVLFGYGSNCATLTQTTTGGTPGYTGVWTDGGGNVVGTTVCPTTTTTYCYTATDANGCTATGCMTVCVIDIRCTGNSNNGNNGGNTGGQSGQGWINGNAVQHVAICHTPPGRVTTSWTMCVPPSAVPAHLAHGDVLGACGVTSNYVCTPSSNKTVEAPAAISVTMETYPNPTNGKVQVELNCEGCYGYAELQLQVMDAMGRMIQSSNIGLVNGRAMSEINLGAEAAGFYFIIATDGETRLIEKVMKQ